MNDGPAWKGYWPQAPAAWFAATELGFWLDGRTEKEKYAYVVGMLPEDLLRNISELVKKPPGNNAYTTLKSRVLAAVNLQKEETEEAEVAAVTWKGKGPPSKKGEGSSTQQSGSRGGQRQRGRRGGQKDKQEASNTSKWVCFKHLRWGSKAHVCEDEERCSFSGN